MQDNHSETGSRLEQNGDQNGHIREGNRQAGDTEEEEGGAHFILKVRRWSQWSSPAEVVEEEKAEEEEEEEEEGEPTAQL